MSAIYMKSQVVPKVSRIITTKAQNNEQQKLTMMAAFERLLKSVTEGVGMF